MQSTSDSWRVWSIQLLSRSTGFLVFLVYGPEIKSNIDTGSWYILQIYCQNRGLNRQKNASLYMVYALFWTLADKSTLPNTLTIWSYKRKILGCLEFVTNLTCLLALSQCKKIIMSIESRSGWPPLSAEKNGLSLSYLVPEILGHKVVGLIFQQNILFDSF